MLAVEIGLAAAFGAVLRYVLHEELPWRTFIINVTGSFLLGLTTGLAAHHGLPAAPTLVIGVGFCGGFTTWSTYCWESLALAEEGAIVPAAGNVIGSLVAGLAAAALGLGLALV